MAVAIQRSDDSKNSPDGLVSGPHFAYLKQGATLSGLTIAGSPNIMTDADAWTAVKQSPAQASGGPVVSATGGSVTITKAGTYRVDYSFSGITIVNTQVLTTEVYKNTTASGGRCSITQLTGAGQDLAGSAILDLVVGDVITVKLTIATADNYTGTVGNLIVQEI